MFFCSENLVWLQNRSIFALEFQKLVCMEKYLYRQHKDMFGKPVPEEKELRFADIQTIAKFINSDWEKELY